METVATHPSNAAELDDAELIRAYVGRNDGDAFAILVRRYMGVIRGVCSRRLGEQTLFLDDCVQTVLVVLSRKAASLPKDVNLGPWLHRVATYVCIDALRRAGRDANRREVVGRDQAQYVEVKQDSESEDNPAYGLLDEAINGLPERERTVTVGHYLEGRSFEKLAEQMRRKAGYVRVTALRARRRLQGLLRRKGVTVAGAAFVAILDGLQAEAAEEGKSLVSGHWSVEECSQQVRTVADAVIADMDRVAAKAMWWTVGGVAAGLATIGVGTALVANYLQPVQVPSGAMIVWRIESVTGSPLARRPGTMQTLKVGDVLCLGDTIVTSSNQEAVVVSDDGDRILLREEGEVGFERRTLNTEHRTSKSEEGYQQFRVVKGSIVAQVKRPTCFVTPHAGVETTGAGFFLMVANGLTTNGAPWSFSRVDVTEGSAKFLPSSISNLRSEIPLVARQAVCVGTDMEGQTIQTMVRKSDCRELSPKYGGVFFREYVELYETKGAALDVLRFTERRALLETNAWQMMDKLTSQGGPKIAKDTLRRTGEPALRIANGTADVARVSFPLGLPSVDAFQVTVQHASRSPDGTYVLRVASVWPLPIQTTGQVVMRTDPESQVVSGGVWNLFKIRCIRVGVAPGGQSIYEIDTGEGNAYVQNNTVCNWVYVQDPEKWGPSISTKGMNVGIGVIRIEELRFAQENAGAGGARGL